MSDDESLHNGPLGALYGPAFESEAQMVKETSGQGRYHDQRWVWSGNPAPEVNALGHFFDNWIYSRLGQNQTFGEIRVDPTWGPRYLRRLGFGGPIWGIDVRPNVLEWAAKTHPVAGVGYTLLKSWNDGNWPVRQCDVGMTAGVAQNFSEIEDLRGFLKRAGGIIRPEGFYFFYAKVVPEEGLDRLVDIYKRQGKQVEIVKRRKESVTLLVPDARLAAILPQLSREDFGKLDKHLQNGQREMTFYYDTSLETEFVRIFDVGEIKTKNGTEFMSLLTTSGSGWRYLALGGTVKQ